MQKENSSSDGGNSNITNQSKSSINTSSRNPFLSPTYFDQFDPTDFTSFYPSLFPPNTTSFSISPSDTSFDDSTNAVATENRLNQASFILEYQQLYNSYTLSLTTLQESIKQVGTLRDENNILRRANTDLVQKLSVLSQAMIQNCIISSGQSSVSFANEFNRLNIGGTEDVSSISPTSVIENNRFETRNADKFAVPKSISVRSGGYMKMNQRGGGSNGTASRPSTRASARHRLTTQFNSGSQRVFVAGGKIEEKALELDVYNQGMLKTELCNKWHETGTCPYGSNCQFAHGVTELRPVIRHPRYKTEVCRMVLAGEICPYGHRCHFRHSLTDEESFLAQR